MQQRRRKSEFKFIHRYWTDDDDNDDDDDDVNDISENIPDNNRVDGQGSDCDSNSGSDNSSSDKAVEKENRFLDRTIPSFNIQNISIVVSKIVEDPMESLLKQQHFQ